MSDSIHDNELIYKYHNLSEKLLYAMMDNDIFLVEKYATEMQLILRKIKALCK